MRYELETRFQQLQSRLAAVTLETEEVSYLFSACFLNGLSDTALARVELCNMSLKP